MIKPAAGGSALGVRFAAGADQVPEALVAAFSYDDRVLLERHVDGRELAISLLDGIALPAVEARPREEDRFNYEARYEIGRTEYVCPADLGADEGAVLDAALRTWDVLGFDGFGRVDLILAPDGPQVLEANAIPGLTDTSPAADGRGGRRPLVRGSLRAIARPRVRAGRQRPPALVDQPALDRPAAELVAIGELQLSQHRADVGLDRLRRDRELERDLLVEVAAGDQAQDLALAQGQLVELGVDLGARGAAPRRRRGRSRRAGVRRPRRRREPGVTASARSGPEIVFVT